MALTLAQFLENAGSVNHARDFRRLFDKLLMGWDIRTAGGLATTGLNNGGVTRYLGAATTGDFAVIQRGAGANMSVDVLMGGAIVGGTESATQGDYFVFNDATTNVTISASDPTNPRIDVIGIRIRDTEYSGASNDATIIVVTGTPAGSPVVPTLPANFLSLAHIAVAALSTQVVTGNITDKRVRTAVAAGGVVPVNGFANLPGVNNWNGQMGFDFTNNLLYVRSQGVWVCITQQFSNVETSETTASAPFVALATAGPSMTIQTRISAAISMHAEISNSGGGYSTISVAVTGATTIAASTGANLGPLNTGTVPIDFTGTPFFNGTLTGGANVFTALYSVQSGTGTFGRRRMTGVGVP